MIFFSGFDIRLYAYVKQYIFEFGLIYHFSFESFCSLCHQCTSPDITLELVRKLQIWKRQRPRSPLAWCWYKTTNDFSVLVSLKINHRWFDKGCAVAINTTWFSFYSSAISNSITYLFNAGLQINLINEQWFSDVIERWTSLSDKIESFHQPPLLIKERREWAWW
jgi:hypothetical protein